MVQQIPINEEFVLKDSGDKQFIEVLPDVAYKRLLFVNVVFIGTAESWLLVDTGVAGSGSFIKRAAESRFGPGSRPEAIILTHGHFDHVGALKDLIEEWNVPVYAHEYELPFLNGTSSYPPPDPAAGGGLMSALSRFYPVGPIDVSESLRTLPSDGSIPSLDDWQWILTPGHTVGHVALFRDSDRTLISGDAIITTAQESAYAAATQECEIHGPPKYFTSNWDAAEKSVSVLADLHPLVLVPGHGRALKSESLGGPLKELSLRFKEVAVPAGE